MTIWIKALLGCVAVIVASSVAQARLVVPEGPDAQIQYFEQSTGAFKDYMLQCAGCHRFDGLGAEHRGIPSFQNSIDLFAQLPQGREYMIRVPGSSQSQLNNADLARVLNWIVAKYGANDMAENFRPFTSAEVGASRPYRFDDVVPVRKQLEKDLQALGYTPSAYLYGRTGRE